MKKAFLFYAFLMLSMSLQAKNYSSQYGFIENKGQVIDQNNNLNPLVKYLWTGNGMKVQLKGNSFSYEVLKTEKFEYRNPTSLRMKRSEMKQSTRDCFVPRSDGAFDDSTVIYSHRIDIELLGANPNPELKPEGQSADYLNYYTTGTPEAGVTYVHHYHKVTYQNIYPNIDLEFVLDATNKQPFKYNFIVRPGGRVSDIQLQYNGANNTELTPTGSLNIATAYGNFEESIPSSYVAETGKDVTVHYQQNREGIYGFSAGYYNGQQTLVIDPWATYYGGTKNDEFLGVSTDSSGNIFAVGGTDSYNNIATTGSYQTSLADTIGDAFIVKFSPNGVRQWGTYFGGIGFDPEEAICSAVESTGNIYVGGVSSALTGIATVGSFQNSLGGDVDGFIAKFDASGIRQWSTYYGGSNTDVIQRISIGASNDIVVIGHTNSLNNIASIGSYQTNNGGNDDAFIAKFSSSGTRLWSTYFGGSDYEDGLGITVDKLGNVIATGVTNSNNGISTSGAFQQNFVGAQNAYICKFSPNGTLQWSSYYGSSNDYSANIITDNSNNIIFVGQTTSTSGFATAGSYQSTINSVNDGFIAKFSASGNRIWATYFGGESDNEGIGSVGIDSFNNIYVTGGTISTTNISSLNSYQSVNNGQADAFLAKFNANGIRLWSTYFGGNKDDEALAICKFIKKNIVIAGGTFSDSNISTSNAFQVNYGGGVSDGFIACFDSSGHFTPDGINDLNQNKETIIEVYPNPAKDKITVSIKDFIDKGGSISLQSIEGKLLKKLSVKAEATNVDMSGFPSGTYLLQYEDGEVCEAVKVVKE